MRRHRLDARLDRLERAHRSATVKGPDRAPFFPIDPALAKSLRDDYERQNKLWRRDVIAGESGGPLSAAELEEMERLRVSIADRARTIGCPVGYGAIQAGDDSNRLGELFSKRITPRSCGGGTLTDAEDAEEAQLRARELVFSESPEGRAQSRIRDLGFKHRWSGLSPAEQEELDRLRTLYPAPPGDSRFKAQMEALQRAVRDVEARQRERDA